MKGNCTYLRELCKWLGNKTKWCLCYGADLFEWNVPDFHSKCDKHPGTVTIVRYDDGIVGGCSDVAWEGINFIKYL